MSEMKPTPGPWFTHREGFSTIYIQASIGGGWVQEIAACGPTNDGSAQQEANARLIAEAGTVFHNTGLSPVQLVEMVKELKAALIEARSVLSSVCTSVHRRVIEDGVTLYTQTDDWCKWAEGEVLDQVRAALAKCEGVKP